MTKAKILIATLLLLALPLTGVSMAQTQLQSGAPHTIVLHAARLLDIKAGRLVKAGEVLVQDQRIVEVGTSVKRPAGAEVIDLGDRTLLPGLIAPTVHLFFHSGAGDLQT